MKRMLIILLMILVNGYVNAKLSIELENSRVSIGQIFRLVLTMDKIQSQGIPDLTPLQTDFNIVGTERSTNYSIINGQTSSTSQWVVLLTAKRVGRLTIPPIRFGQEQTKTTTIEVTDTPATASQNINKRRDVLLIATVNNKQPYINEQIIYTVKLYSSQNLLDASYLEPTINDALLIPLGNGKRYQTFENDHHYVVDEQQYAIFPQKSGQLTIVPPKFNALIYNSIPEQIRVSAQTITLNVKAEPAISYGIHWLPAKQILLSESYDKNTDTLLQGSTLTRTITLQAIGLPAQLLPALTFANSDLFSAYSDKAVEKNKFEQNNVVGIATVKVTYLLNKIGKIVIPVQKLSWFNTVTGKLETAILPELTINVTANSSSSTQQAARQVNKISSKKQVTKESAQTSTRQTTEANLTAKSKQSSVTNVHTTNSSPLRSTAYPRSLESASNLTAWWIAAGFALAWFITLVLWWWKQRHPPLFVNNERFILKQLKHACGTNQPELAKEALMRWACWKWPNANVLNLADINNKLMQNNALKKQIHELIKALYHKTEHTSWYGNELWRCIASYQNSCPDKSIDKSASLPPINPN